MVLVTLMSLPKPDSPPTKDKFLVQSIRNSLMPSQENNNNYENDVLVAVSFISAPILHFPSPPASLPTPSFANPSLYPFSTFAPFSPFAPSLPFYLFTI